MKGLMLTLMLLSWTGMVVAQQSNVNRFDSMSGTSSTENGFGAAKKSEPGVVPIVGADDSRFGARQPESGQTQNDRVKNSFAMRRPSSMLGPQSGQAGSPRSPYRPTASESQSSKNLTLGSAQIDQLVREGSVLSLKFDSQRQERIQISDQEGAKVGGLQTITPRLVDETLVFQLSSDQLKNIDQYTFEYNVPAYQRGRYNQIAVTYPEALNRVASSRVEGNFQPASNDSSLANRWRIAGQKDPQHDPMRENDRFGVQNRRQQIRNQQTDIQDTAFRTEQERQQREKWERERAENERLRLAEENRVLQRKIDLSNQLDAKYNQRLNDLQRQLQQGRYADNSFRAGATQPVVSPNYQSAVPQNQLATNTGVSPQVQVEMMRLLEAKNKSEVEKARLEAKNQLLENKLSLAGYENRDPNQTRALFNNRNGIVDRKPAATDTAPLSGVFVPGGDRPLLSAGENPRNESQTGTSISKDKKPAADSTELMMFILLVGSIGLNLYLWFVARSFHSRYEELANELRETFTATV